MLRKLDSHELIWADFANDPELLQNFSNQVAIPLTGRNTRLNSKTGSTLEPRWSGADRPDHTDPRQPCRGPVSPWREPISPERTGPGATGRGPCPPTSLVPRERAGGDPRADQLDLVARESGARCAARDLLRLSVGSRAKLGQPRAKAPPEPEVALAARPQTTRAFTTAGAMMAMAAAKRRRWRRLHVVRAGAGEVITPVFHLPGLGAAVGLPNDMYGATCVAAARHHAPSPLVLARRTDSILQYTGGPEVFRP